jgi:hypothetical protein
LGSWLWDWKLVWEGRRGQYQLMNEEVALELKTMLAEENQYVAMVKVHMFLQVLVTKEKQYLKKELL